MPRRLLTRLAPPRDAPCELLQPFLLHHGGELQGELRRWIKLGEEWDLSAVGTRTRFALDDYDGLFALLERAVDVERIQSLLCATTIVARREETFYCASWAAADDGASRVYCIHRDHRGMRAAFPSIAVMFFELLGEEGDAEAPAPAGAPPPALATLPPDERAAWRAALQSYGQLPHLRPIPPLDPERLFDRVEWLIDFLLFALKGAPPEAWRERLARAAPVAAYAEERELLAGWPHLAVYWLWSHLLLGDGELLEDALARCADQVNPVVVESRELVTALRDGREPGPEELAARFAEFRRSLAGGAPEPPLEPERDAEAPSPRVATVDPRVSPALERVDRGDRGDPVEDVPEDAGAAALLAAADYQSSELDREAVLQAVLDAGRLRLARSVGDIERAIAGGIGLRGHHPAPLYGPVLRALYHAGDDQGFSFVEDLRRQLLAEEAALADDDERRCHRQRLAAVVAAQLMMRPSHRATNLHFHEQARCYLGLSQAGERDFLGMSYLITAVDEARLGGHEDILRAFARHRTRLRDDATGQACALMRQRARETLERSKAGWPPSLE